jgi:hypothetical protein
VPVKVAALAQAVLKGMSLGKIKAATVVLLSALALSAGTGLLAGAALTADPAQSGSAGADRRVEVAPGPGSHPTVGRESPREQPSTSGPKEAPPPERDAQQDHSGRVWSGANDERQDEDEDEDEGQKCEGVVKQFEASTNTLTITVRRKGGERDQVFTMTRETRVRLLGSASNASDVRPGMRVALRLSGEGNSVVEVRELKAAQKAGPMKNKGGKNTEGD